MNVPATIDPRSAPAVAANPTVGNVELTIIMPCLNEAETLEGCILEAAKFLETSGVAGEILIGDNGSTDGSQEIARRCGARVIDVPLRGYGAALFGASKAARGRFIIMGDSDGSYDFSNLMPFIEKLREGYDLVIGNRFQGGIHPGAMPWKNRYIGNPTLSGIGRLFFRCPARDFHCGIRGYSLEAFNKLDLRTTGMEFASEMVIKATLFHFRIAEVPTSLRVDGRSRPPHLRPWRDGWRHLRFMLLYSPRWLFLYPGMLLMALGLIVGSLVLGGPRQIGTVTFDVHTLLYAAVAILLGFQCVTFAVFAKAFAINEGLLPYDSVFESFFRVFTLEAGLVVGAALFLIGLIGSLLALQSWQTHGFGPLQTSDTMRKVIPSMLALTLGCQTVLSSFMLSVLGLRLRRA